MEGSAERQVRLPDAEPVKVLRFSAKEIRTRNSSEENRVSAHLLDQPFQFQKTIHPLLLREVEIKYSSLIEASPKLLVTYNCAWCARFTVARVRISQEIIDKQKELYDYSVVFKTVQDGRRIDGHPLEL